MAAEGPAIGIDLGTTYSCVGVWKEGHVEIIPNEQGNRTTPSCVAFTDTEHLVGEAALNQIAKNPTNTVFDVKRLIGREFSDPLVQCDVGLWPFKVISGALDDKPVIVVTYRGEEREFSAVEISSMVLLKLKNNAEAFLGTDVKNAVITVPACFNDSQRLATKQAATIAGLNVMQILNEPTSAAIAYGLDKVSESNNESGKNILIFDLGGGTFDVSLMTIAGGHFEVKAVGGDTHLGGVDFDNRMVNYFVEKLKKKYGKDISGNAKSLRRLRYACERAKRVLSYSVIASLEINFLVHDHDHSVTITRAEFEDLMLGLFRKCLETVKECLVDAKMDKRSIDDIVLVGGSSRIPKVRELLKDFFNAKELRENINPDEAVAYGASVRAASLNGQAGKVNTLTVSDVTPLSLGIHVHGDTLSVIVPRNTKIPTRKEQVYATSRDNQTCFTFKVYEGERARSGDNNLLGKFILNGIPATHCGGSEVKVCFEIDVNGILTVFAQSLVTGNTSELLVRSDKRTLSQEEVNRMLEDAMKFRAQDEEFKKRVGARTALEAYAYEMRKTIKTLRAPANLPTVQKKLVEDVFDSTMQWLNDNPLASTHDLKLKLEELKNIWRPIASQILGNA